VARLAGRLFRAIGRILARLFVILRYPVILAWIAGAVWVAVALPALGGSDITSFNDLVPPHSPTLQAEQTSTREFGFPLLSETLVVVRNPHGLSPARTAQLASLSERLSTGHLPGLTDIQGAIPLANTIGGPALSPEHNTTAVLYLFFRPSVGPSLQASTAARLIRTQIGHRPGEYVGYTGPAPAEATQATDINNLLIWVSLGTILLVALAIAVHFRSPGSAILAVATVAIAYLVANRLVEQFALHGGAAVPAEAQPVLVVLLFGIVTDYSIFFMSRARALLREGHEPRTMGLDLTRQILPIIFVAGVTVALGTAALLGASIGYLRGFGPGLAISVLVGMVVAATFVPAVLSVGGRWIFWPARLEPPESAPAAKTDPDPAGAAPPPRRWTIRTAVRHPIVSLLLVVVLIAAAATGLARLAIGNSLVTDLPASAEPRQAYDQASKGFSQGVLSPGELLVAGPNVAAQRAALARLEPLIARQPDMAQVFGPQQAPVARRLGFAVAPSGRAARYVFFLHSDPLGATGISAVQTLRDRLTGLIRQAGLTNTTGAVAGDTALSADIVNGTVTSLERVVPLALLLIFLVVALYLRALVAPFFLVLTSLLGVVASLGITVWVLQVGLGWGQIDYYVIFTVGVMLISLGSDYNVFLVGRIWQEGPLRRFGDAIEVGGSRAARAITTAGFILAASFALLAIVPLRPFREIALAMAVGLLVDTLLVRTILVPAMLSLLGPRSAWPGRALRQKPRTPDRAPERPPEREVAGVTPGG
jgi:RND superfamily putative drug exporter